MHRQRPAMCFTYLVKPHHRIDSWTEEKVFLSLKRITTNVQGLVIIYRYSKKIGIFLEKYDRMFISLQRKKNMPLIMENDISQKAVTATLTGLYPFYEIFHLQKAKWLKYILNNFTNSIWPVGVDLTFYVSVINCGQLFQR